LAKEHSHPTKEQLGIYLDSTLFKLELTLFENEKKVRENSVIKIVHTKTSYYLSSCEIIDEFKQMVTGVSS
jgi:hypothetical protein